MKNTKKTLLMHKDIKRNKTQTANPGQREREDGQTMPRQGTM